MTITKGKLAVFAIVVALAVVLDASLWECFAVSFSVWGAYSIGAGERP